MAKVVIAVVGPTAIGKTVRAISLARHFNTEIISADSRQFFKELAIGTAVPSPEELSAAKHHCIQHISIHQQYSVGDFEQEALDRLNHLFKTKDVVVLVGGSGLYVDAVLQGLDYFPEVDTNIRLQLNQQLAQEGLLSLQNKLQDLDPAYYAQVDLDNPHRVIRALEVCLTADAPYSSFLGKKKPARPFKSLLVGLQADRELVYDRINQRVDLMMEAGLLQEAQKLYAYKHLNALNTVGYKELFAHFDGETDLATAVSEIKKNTRRFAKRQLTWYRKNKAIYWVDYQLPEADFLKAVGEQIKLL